MTASPNDEYWMSAALSLGAEGQGLTRPNPPVGAVIVKHNQMVGSGYHPAAGKPHAEVYALRDAGDKAEGATLYVTLEPCSTTGRTPPCTESIIRAGIKRVVYGCDDPNPLHAGKAARKLRKAGVLVTRNVLKEECRDLISPFECLILKGRPFVSLKLACTLDGKIADARKKSKWITGKEAREVVQDLRRTADAIMVGAGTVRADDPSLLPRPARGRKPFRVIVSRSGKIPAKSRVLSDAAASRTIVYTSRSLTYVMSDLAKRGCMHVVCEGGGDLAGSLLKSDYVDELHVFYSPKVIGRWGVDAFAGGWSLHEAPGFVLSSAEMVGEDIWLHLKRKRQV